MKRRKLDGVLIFMAFIVFALLSAVTVMQQLQIKELAHNQTLLVMFIDEKLNLIEAKTTAMVSTVEAYKLKAQPGVWDIELTGGRDAALARNPLTTPK